MLKKICIFVVFIFSGCAEAPSFESFSHEGNKGEKEFRVDSQKCEKEKDKHSNKIQGREFGFEGQNTGYWGCMKLEGWSKKPV
ncbi:MAG: hypothetical protein H8E32_10000 [Nitrospinae bacterium]|nr:hypothetical protein [Nitrospinota bacterium]